MTAVAGASSNFTFNKSMFSDPGMRSYLEEYYEDKYAPVRERIAGMEKAEANGEAPKTIRTRDGQIANELSAAQYKAMIPSFDKWLDIQENVISPFEMADQSASSLNQAQKSLETAKKTLDPDSSSGVRTVFSDGDQILAYINKDGSLVTHGGASGLQKIAEQADQLNLTGEAKIAYIQQYGEAELSRCYPGLQITEYDSTNTPSRREFSEQWYPNHDIDAAYGSTLKEAREFQEQQAALYKQQMENLNSFRLAMIQIMEEAHNAEAAA